MNTMQRVICGGAWFVCLFTVSCGGTTQRRSEANGGPEDPPIQEVERLGGDCIRAADMRCLHPGKPDLEDLDDVAGDPVVYVSLQDKQDKRVTVADLLNLALHPNSEGFSPARDERDK